MGKERINCTKIHMSELKKTIENAAKERKAYLEKYEKKKEQMNLATQVVLDLLQSEKSVKNDDVKKDPSVSCMGKDWFGGSSDFLSFMKQLIGGSSDKKKKQMILATEFVLDLLQSEKSVKNDDVKKDLSFMRKDWFGGSSERNNGEKYQSLDQDTIWSKIAKFHHVDRPSDYQGGAEFWEKPAFLERKLHEKYGKPSERKTFKHFTVEDLSQILEVLAEKDFVKTEPPYQPKQSNGPKVKYMYSYSEEIPQLVNQ